MAVPFEYIFPDPSEADEEGLVAVGGDLSVKALLTAYTKGIFPWFDENSPYLWWCPDPRLVLFPDRFRISYTLNQVIRREKYKIRFDHNFKKVIHHCARMKRKGQNGTWITSEIQQAYCDLHREGYAHSVECYFEGKLVGGLYGVSLGRAFFGESMFHSMADASKVALYHLVRRLKDWDFQFIDAQQSTAHLKSLGAEEISRKKFLAMLKTALEFPTKRGNWEKVQI